MYGQYLVLALLVLDSIRFVTGAGQKSADTYGTLKSMQWINLRSLLQIQQDPMLNYPLLFNVSQVSIDF